MKRHLETRRGYSENQLAPSRLIAKISLKCARLIAESNRASGNSRGRQACLVAVEHRHYVTDIHATVLHQLGLDHRAAPDAVPEVARAQRLLRNHWQQHFAEPISRGGQARLAQMAATSQAGRPWCLDVVQSRSGTLSTASTCGDPFGVPCAKRT